MLTAPANPLRFDDLDTPLAQVTFVMLDLETTGTDPGRDSITEIGAAKYRGGECLGHFETLVNPGVPIPPYITVITGITQAMVLPAPRIEEILPALLEFIGTAVLVGHNFHFDTGFLDAALMRRGGSRLENPRVDTLGISRRLLRDDVPDLKLGTLANHLRVSVQPCHRAMADADATAEVFHALLERAGTLGVSALDDLLTLSKLRAHASMSKLRLTARLPRGPGVYRFRDRTGQVLFVGRATNLRARVRAHFHGDRRKVPQLLRETEAIDWIECTDDLEASVREARLVQELEPRFNRNGKGWRAYVYLKLTLGERFPRLAVVRDVRDDGTQYFGPLRTAGEADAVRAAIESAVPLRRCTTRLGRRIEARPATPCPASPASPRCPCVGLTPEAEYEHTVTAVSRGLGGEPDLLLEPLARRLEALIGAEQYEDAAIARDQLDALGQALRHHALLTSLRTSGTLRYLTATGIVELENGILRVDDEAGTTPALTLERHRLDELLVVARWIDREVTADRARPLPG